MGTSLSDPLACGCPRPLRHLQRLPQPNPRARRVDHDSLSRRRSGCVHRRRSGHAGATHCTDAARRPASTSSSAPASSDHSMPTGGDRGHDGGRRPRPADLVVRPAIAETVATLASPVRPPMSNSRTAVSRSAAVDQPTPGPAASHRGSSTSTPPSSANWRRDSPRPTRRSTSAGPGRPPPMAPGRRSMVHPGQRPATIRRHLTGTTGPTSRRTRPTPLTRSWSGRLGWTSGIGWWRILADAGRPRRATAAPTGIYGTASHGPCPSCAARTIRACWTGLFQVGGTAHSPAGSAAGRDGRRDRPTSRGLTG